VTPESVVRFGARLPGHATPTGRTPRAHAPPPRHRARRSDPPEAAGRRRDRVRRPRLPRHVVADITQRAGVAQGTFYLYFPSKEDALRELVRHMGHELRHALATATAGAADRLAVERRGFEAFARFSLRHRNLYRIVMESQFVDEAIYRGYYEALADGLRRRAPARHRARRAPRRRPRGRRLGADGRRPLRRPALRHLAGARAAARGARRRLRPRPARSGAAPVSTRAALAERPAPEAAPAPAAHGAAGVTGIATYVPEGRMTPEQLAEATGIPAWVVRDKLGLHGRVVPTPTTSRPRWPCRRARRPGARGAHARRRRRGHLHHRGAQGVPGLDGRHQARPRPRRRTAPTPSTSARSAAPRCWRSSSRATSWRPTPRSTWC
jgi:AcrR family transcriptional regulator